MNLSTKVFLVSFICLLSSIKLIEASCNENQTSTDGSAWEKVKCSFLTGGRHLKDGWITAVDGVKNGVNRVKQQIHGTSTMVEEKSFEVKVGESQIDEQESQIHNYRKTSRADHQLNDISTTTPESSVKNSNLKRRSLFTTPPSCCHLHYLEPGSCRCFIFDHVPKNCPVGYGLRNGLCRQMDMHDGITTES